MSNKLVSNVKIKDISPSLPGEAGKLLPKVLKPVRCSFELNGVNLALARGITRVIQSELLVKVLTFDDGDYETNDDFMLRDFVKNRVMCIPIKQAENLGEVFTLSVINNTHAPMYVKTAKIQRARGNAGLPCNETADVAFIAPNKYLTIKKMYVIEGYGYNFGGMTLTSGALNVPLDVEPINLYTGKGVSSSVSNPQKHKIQFDTNGTIEPKKVVAMACKEIIRRLEGIRELMYTMRKSGETHKLTIKGENSTTGNIVMRMVCDMYPDVDAITYNVDAIDRVLDISIKSDDPNEILQGAIKSAIIILKDIGNAIGQ